MELSLKRFDKKSDYTKGLLYIDGNFECFTLEDEEREVKVKHETAIPEGRYEVKLRTVGGFHSRYSKRFPDLHKGMLELQDVPDFKYILIHIGNTEKNTSGCILVGESTNSTKETIERSKLAYIAMYERIIKAFERNEKVFINITSV